MKANKPQRKSISIFEKLRKTDKTGHEYWSAKDLARLLGYSSYSSFIEVLDKAKASCINTGQETAVHFKDFSAIRSVGNDLQRNGGDVKLSRYGCYLIIQNSDPALKPVALGQAYFAIQARLQELSQQQKSKNFRIVKERRYFLRKELAKKNLQLAGVARKAGIVKPADYAFFQNHGYRGLYGGLDVKAIREIRGLDPDENILDRMDNIELAANLFRVTQTTEKLNNDNVDDLVEANSIHFAVGLKTRKAIEETIGILPEDFPFADNIKLTKSKEKKMKTRKSSKIKLFYN
ncbi:DNA damage-inducible protein D [Flavobacterium sp. 1355]|jgi:DNA-damage-inducible protein D|uniref:DNA damage-inducible protein D n=1 Tax=Flavobacterium sp. 1355 TaxID=2806571 RepID=UPI001AE8C2F2|nr:DNA damage-inducible protein D [Flavobacterium sp. 1355]MBP1223047.1 DNA-damage-inducible protein D [Flavobacterium sp. 1355]